VLRVLQGQAFVRVGGTRMIRVNVRLVPATSRDLAQMVADAAREPVLHVRRETQEVIGGRTTLRRASASTARRCSLAGRTSAVRARCRDGMLSPVKEFRSPSDGSVLSAAPFHPPPHALHGLL
jgi:hypothetical protein